MKYECEHSLRHGRKATRVWVSARTRRQNLRNSKMRPNPSIEGMPKRLRLLCTPHVKR
jgi:hypothetical protein